MDDPVRLRPLVRSSIRPLPPPTTAPGPSRSSTGSWSPAAPTGRPAMVCRYSGIQVFRIELELELDPEDPNTRTPEHPNTCTPEHRIPPRWIPTTASSG